LTTRSNKAIAQWKKEEANLKMEQLDEKRRKEVEDKAKADCIEMQETSG